MSMLPFRNRLVKRKDFAAVQKKGAFFREGVIVLKVLETKQAETRIGVVAGISFSKKAVERNRVKRQVREVLKSQIGQISKGYDIVVMARNPQNMKITSKLLQDQLKSGLQKANLLAGRKA